MSSLQQALKKSLRMTTTDISLFFSNDYNWSIIVFKNDYNWYIIVFENDYKWYIIVLHLQSTTKSP